MSAPGERRLSFKRDVQYRSEIISPRLGLVAIISFMISSSSSALMYKEEKLDVSVRERKMVTNKRTKGI
jgi:hypothetical protein